MIERISLEGGLSIYNNYCRILMEDPMDRYDVGLFPSLYNFPSFNSSMPGERMEVLAPSCAWFRNATHELQLQNGDIKSYAQVFS